MMTDPVLMRILTSGPAPVDVIWERPRALELLRAFFGGTLGSRTVGEMDAPQPWAVDTDSIVGVQVCNLPDEHVQKLTGKNPKTWSVQVGGHQTLNQSGYQRN